MLALLALLASAPARVSAGVAVPAVQSPIQITLNGGDYRPGDRVRVEVSTGDDGYLLVLRVDGDGFVRVLFPVDPDLDTYVRGGSRYELQGRGDDATFLADDRGGTGLILAFLARRPYDFSAYATSVRWDYDRLRLGDLGGDAEAQLVAVVGRMVGGGGFDYDVVGYRVWGPGFEGAQPVIVASGGGYDPYFDACLACGWRGTRLSIGIGIGGRWNDPWYDPWYDPWNSWNHWGYGGYSGWNGWYGWDPYWGTPWRPITIINTPIRPTRPNPIYGTRARVRQGGFGTLGGYDRRPGDRSPGAEVAPIPGNNRRVDDGRSRRRTNAAPTVSPPPARPAASPPERSASPRPSSPPPTTGTPERSRSRRPPVGLTEQPGSSAAAVTPRVSERREVYRPPAGAVERSSQPIRREVRPGSRPASSPPPRQASANERPAPRPVARSAPSPRQPAPSSVGGSSRRSSPSPAPGGSGGRSRSRGPN